MKHAWDDAETAWGKLALILFYTLIWGTILTSAWSLIFPMSQGGACIMKSSLHKGSDELWNTMTRAINILLIGFMAYADVGGMKAKNVYMVTIFLIALSLAALPLRDEIRACGMGYLLYVPPAVGLVALLCTMIENKYSDRGSVRERESLNV
jgi:hypothetical protein